MCKCVCGGDICVCVHVCVSLYGLPGSMDDLQSFGLNSGSVRVCMLDVVINHLAFWVCTIGLGTQCIVPLP